MASEYYYPDWIEQALHKGWFKFDNETNTYKYNNPTNNHKNKFEFKPNANKGDLIRFTPKGKEGQLYRNEGVWIWDGKNIQPLHTEIDDYGSVPPEFKVGKDFRPDHWIDKIDHNNIIWLEDDIIENIIINKNLNGQVKIFNKIYNVDIHCEALNIDTNLSSVLYPHSLTNDLHKYKLFEENNEIKLFKNNVDKLYEKLYKIELEDETIKNKLIEYIKNEYVYVQVKWIQNEQKQKMFIKMDEIEYPIKMTYIMKDKQILMKLLKEKIIINKPCFHYLDDNQLEVYI